MAVRAAIAKETLFDERLRLYALFEDMDFGIRCQRRGRVVSYRGCVAVHLAERAGRILSTQFGFAQVMNPYYLWRKGSFSNAEALNWLSRPFLGNLKGLIKPYKGRSRADRVKQIAGNCIALFAILKSGAVPEQIEKVH
jgi:GT2 family glycosyltransferase